MIQVEWAVREIDIPRAGLRSRHGSARGPIGRPVGDRANGCGTRRARVYCALRHARLFPG
ncbi:hypothetical protein AX27061_3736 [Achromobacter xylosoxidans NBRC 15126 = ATCC 27061]|nr:hypothetical protein AX27061_3736 [Achromobacter xylosoxidans NBRC 15126 = ATCC 27061]CCH09425.1 hypothetical protein NH44784_054821 [Achromobacter xylosoxidans NH44784-1996]